MKEFSLRDGLTLTGLSIATTATLVASANTEQIDNTLLGNALTQHGEVIASRGLGGLLIVLSAATVAKTGEIITRPLRRRSRASQNRR